MAGWEHLHPLELIATAAQVPRDSFAEYAGGEELMLVCLAGQPDSLHQGLANAPQADMRAWYPKNREDSAYTAISTEGMGDDVGAATEAMSPTGLARILQEAHFVLPLRKTAAGLINDPERISVGRASANDIVLPHHTISNLHAWFEHDSSGCIFVSDAGSTNFTRIGTRTLVSQELIRVLPGQAIRFGEVTTRIVPATLLWQALAHGARS